MKILNKLESHFCVEKENGCELRQNANLQVNLKNSSVFHWINILKSEELSTILQIIFCVHLSFPF